MDRPEVTFEQRAKIMLYPYALNEIQSYGFYHGNMALHGCAAGTRYGRNLIAGSLALAIAAEATRVGMKRNRRSVPYVIALCTATAGAGLGAALIRQNYRMLMCALRQYDLNF